MAPALNKKFLDIQATLKCKFTLKLTRDMITYIILHQIAVYVLCYIYNLFVVIHNYCNTGNHCKVHAMDKLKKSTARKPCGFTRSTPPMKTTLTW